MLISDRNTSQSLPDICRLRASPSVDAAAAQMDREAFVDRQEARGRRLSKRHFRHKQFMDEDIPWRRCANPIHRSKLNAQHDSSTHKRKWQHMAHLAQLLKLHIRCSPSPSSRYEKRQWRYVRPNPEAAGPQRFNNDCPSTHKGIFSMEEQEGRVEGTRG